MAKAIKNVFTAANKGELKDLLIQAAQSKAQVAKVEKPVPQVCNAQVHAAIVTIGRMEEASNKADGKRYPAFKEMLRLALPLMADVGQWAAIVIDLHQALKARNLPAVGVQLVGVVNNARHIAYGKAATRDKGAEVERQCWPHNPTTEVQADHDPVLPCSQRPGGVALWLHLE